MSRRRYGKKGVRNRKKKEALLSYQQEVMGVLVVALLAFLSLAFISYNPTDNSWFYFSSTNKAVANWGGVVGAHISALAFFLFGSGSYVLLVCLALFVFFLLSKRVARGTVAEGSALFRFSALPVFFILSTLLFRIHHFDFISPEPGGVVGRFLGALFEMVLGSTGSILATYTLLWVCMLFLAQISFVQFGKSILTAFVVSGVSLGRTAWAGLRLGGLGVYHFARLAGTFGLFLGGKAWGAFRKRFLNPKKEVPFRMKKREGDENETLYDELRYLSSKRALGGGKKAPGATIQPPRAETISEEVFAHEGISVRQKGGIVKTVFCPRNSLFSPALFENGFFTKVLAQASFYAEMPVEDPPSRVDVLYEVPEFSAFQEVRPPQHDEEAFEEKCRERGKMLEEKLLHFGVKGEVTAIRPGPVITLFEYKPEIDSKISKIVSLEDDLAMALTALSIRIIAPIPGRNVIGFEISNKTRQDVFLGDVLKAQPSANNEAGGGKSCSLPLAFGVDITGNPIIHDLVSMPHILVAGSTGSGKSVGLNAMLVSLLCQMTPEDLKLILIDPKRLEFAPYADVPHLLFPIVTNPRKAIPVLKWVVQEMEDRYDLMARVGVRSILDYRKRYAEEKRRLGGREPEGLPPMPFIVLTIDELADLMMVAGKDVETQIARTAQMARAAGIHMIVATQRPSVDVLTGIIKVNFPARIAFRVSSKIDSRTIIDAPGAEKLLGRGDMLFLHPRSSALHRVHGAYVSGREISRLTDYLRFQQEVAYLDLNDALRRDGLADKNSFQDELYGDIKTFVATIDEVSISMLQRKFRIGFNRSARIIEQLELDGLVAPSQGGKMRKVIRE